MRQPFDWDLIRAFLAVARNGKLTGGAKHLRIDHSTLSRRLATLEKSLGTKLFDHNVSGYSLTAQGEQLLVRAEGIESSIFALDRQFGQSTRISGAVRIGAPDGFAGRGILLDSFPAGPETKRRSMKVGGGSDSGREGRRRRMVFHQGQSR